MKISQEYRNILTAEFKYSAKKMREYPSPEQKIYYFSNTFGVLHRVFNLEYDLQLVFAHFVLVTAHGNISARIQAIKSGDEVVSFPGEYFDRLSEHVETLASMIEKDENLLGTLAKIAELAYLTSGNGYFLYEKKILKI
jgi:hypothetical protein